MADSWGEYFRGTDAQIEEDRRLRQAEYDKIVSDKTYQVLKRLGESQVPGALLGMPDNRDYDPREIRLAMVQDTMRPSPSTDFGKDFGAAADKAGKGLGAAYSAVFETTMRPRDTLIKAAQAWNEYNDAATKAAGGYNDDDVNDKFYSAMGLLGRAPLSIIYPPAAAGTPGSEDDWRPQARKLGISEGNIAAIDFGTDPETWLPIPIPFMAAGRAARYAKPALGAMRYGRGVPTHLVDEAGDIIRRLRNSPRVSP